MEINEIEGVFLAIQKLVVVKISIKPNHGDNPQLIFESLNSTGLDLEEADKIRNFILMDLTVEDQEIYYTKYWAKIENETLHNVSALIIERYVYGNYPNVHLLKRMRKTGMV